jgi:hypothetical protein
MVTDIDRTFGAEKCEDVLCPQNNDVSCAPDEPAYPCSQSPTACDALFGASVTFPIGSGAANVDCGFSPFLTSADKPALDCALTIGEGTESVGFGGTLQGLLGPTNAPCNGGFIRPDAKLVIVVLTNKDDNSFTNPPDWIASVKAVRPPESMAIIAVTNNTPRIDQFVAAFPNTLVGSANAADFGPTMDAAATLTLQTFCP